MILRFVVLALAGLLAFPVCAQEGAHGGAPAANPSVKAAPGTRVEMPPIIAPMQDSAGRLSGYAYISSTVIAASPDVASAIRAKAPFIQDAFVRSVNTQAVGLASDLSQIDKPAIEARFLAQARKIAGTKAVVAVTITQVQMSALRGGPPSTVPVAAPPSNTAAAQQGKAPTH